MNEKYPFSLKPLTYPYSALEPHIDEKTMILHHDKHLKTYVDNLNDVLKDYPQYHNFDLETILRNLYSIDPKIREKVRNNAGGVYNHNLYFKLIEPYNKEDKRLEIEDAIIENFSSVNNFFEIFKKNAKNNFGSGYTFLVLDKNKMLKIVNTKNQDTVLEMNLCPLLLIDVWEHAYYLKYNNLRDEYIDNFLKVVNWKNVNERYLECLKCE